MNTQTAMAETTTDPIVKTAIPPFLHTAKQTQPLRYQRFEVAGRPYLLSIASSMADRRQAYEFVFDIYRRQGFTDPSDPPLWYSVHNAVPGTVTFLVHDEEGRPVASGTVVPDSPLGLPMERMYHDEVQSLRRAGRRVCEINSLVSGAATEGWRGRNIILKVFSAAFWYARNVLGADDFLCVTSPEHARFYSRVLLLDTIGPMRLDPHANGAASLALRLDVATAEERFRATYDRQPGPRNLFRFFCPSARAIGDLTEWIQRSAEPLTEKTFRSFFVEPRDCLRDCSPSQLEFLRNAYPHFALWREAGKIPADTASHQLLPASTPAVPAPVVIRSRAVSGDRTSLYVELRRHSDAPRPDWWDILKQFFDNAGFDMDPWSDENGEIFLPTSFFHAETAMRAEKVYNADSIPSLHRDMDDISRLSAMANNTRWNARCS